MEDNNDANQTQPSENPLEKIASEAQMLLGQIQQIVADCQTQSNTLNEKSQSLTAKTETLTQEQTKIENLLQQITDIKNSVDSEKTTTHEIVKTIKNKQNAINTVAEEIKNTKTSADTNNNAIQQIKTTIEKIEESSSQAKVIVDTNNKTISQTKVEVESNAKAVKQSKANVDTLETKLKAIADTANEKTKTIEEYTTALDELNNTWSNAFEKTLNSKANALSELHSTYTERHTELERKIETLLPGATGAGLAKAFMDRKESIEKQKKFWRNMTIVGASGLVLFGLLAIKFPPNIGNSTYDFLVYILTRSSILVGIVMIEEFGRRHFNIISRLSETYAYKEVLSRSFEGYRKQMEDIELNKSVTTVEIDATGNECKKSSPMKASSKLSDNLLNNLNEDPSSIYEKEKSIPTPAVDTAELIAQTANNATEQLAKNRFDIGWKLFALTTVIALVAGAATTIILLAK